jgi:hypothetical protein
MLLQLVLVRMNRCAADLVYLFPEFIEVADRVPGLLGAGRWIDNPSRQPFPMWKAMEYAIGFVELLHTHMDRHIGV